MTSVKVELRRVGPCAFEATNRQGHRIVLDGSPTLRERILERVADPSVLPGAEGNAGTTQPPTPHEGAGLRPMELFLCSLAGCSAMDVVMIVTRQRQDLRELRITATGQRADATPAVYERIDLRFEARGGSVDPKKLERAVELAVTKYCSVAMMLKPDLPIGFETAVTPD